VKYRGGPKLISYAKGTFRQKNHYGPESMPGLTVPDALKLRDTRVGERPVGARHAVPLHMNDTGRWKLHYQ